MLYPGEKEAVETVLKHGAQYGYGNLIAHLGRAWAEELVKDYGVSEKAAIDRVSHQTPYSLRLEKQ